MPLVLAGLMRRLSRSERLRINAQRSDLREDFLVYKLANATLWHKNVL